MISRNVPRSPRVPTTAGHGGQGPGNRCPASSRRWDEPGLLIPEGFDQLRVTYRFLWYANHNTSLILFVKKEDENRGGEETCGGEDNGGEPFPAKQPGDYRCPVEADAGDPCNQDAGNRAVFLDEGVFFGLFPDLPDKGRYLLCAKENHLFF